MMRPGKHNAKRAGAPPLTLGERLARWRWRAVVALWVAGVAAAGFGVAALEPMARRISNAPLRLHWVNLPMWLSDPAQAGFLRQRERDAGLVASDSLHDHGLCRRVAERLAASPWIARVNGVVVVSDGQVRVDATFRMPVAMVQSGGLAFLIDAGGVRLPLQMPAGQVDRRDWLVITGVQSSVPREGEAWAGTDVAAGLKLVNYLLREQLAGRVAFRPILRDIDVSNVGLRRDRLGGEIQLTTTNPVGRIHWGLTPDEEWEMERPAASKLSVLNELFAAQKLQSTQQEIDIRDKNRVLGRQPQ